MLRRLYHWVLSWAASPRAEYALGALSFAESSVFPIPADVLFLPMVATRPDRAWRYALTATVTSVLGGIFGWFVGHYAFQWFGVPVLQFYGKLDAFNALSARVAGQHWIILGLLVTSGASHLPPMKVVTLLSGVVGFSLPWFVISAIVARGARFYLLGWILRRWGQDVLHFIERRLAWVVSALAVLLGALYLVLKVTG